MWTLGNLDRVQVQVHTQNTKKLQQNQLGQFKHVHVRSGSTAGQNDHQTPTLNVPTQLDRWIHRIRLRRAFILKQ